MRLALPVILLFCSTTIAQAITLGDQKCSDAEIIASIHKQAYERVKTDDPNVILMDVLIALDFDVKRVVHGDVPGHRLVATTMAHTLFNTRIKSWRVFLQRSGPHWLIADCRIRSR